MPVKLNDLCKCKSFPVWVLWHSQFNYNKLKLQILPQLGFMFSWKACIYADIWRIVDCGDISVIASISGSWIGCVFLMNPDYHSFLMSCHVTCCSAECLCPWKWGIVVSRGEKTPYIQTLRRDKSLCEFVRKHLQIMASCSEGNLMDTAEWPENVFGLKMTFLNMNHCVFLRTKKKFLGIITKKGINSKCFIL